VVGAVEGLPQRLAEQELVVEEDLMPDFNQRFPFRSTITHVVVLDLDTLSTAGWSYMGTVDL
jgi:hypothetical protein